MGIYGWFPFDFYFQINEFIINQNRIIAVTTVTTITNYGYIWVLYRFDNFLKVIKSNPGKGAIVGNFQTT